MAPPAGLKERHALGHLGVADDDAGLRLREVLGRIERRHEGIDVVAVHALHVPAERLEAGRERLEASDLRGRAVRLLVVDVDDADLVVELPVAGRPGVFPDPAFAELTVGEQAIDEGLRLLPL